MNGYQRKRIDGCLENDSKLSAWEHDFILSLSERPDEYELTDRQNHWLNKVAEKVDG